MILHMLKNKIGQWYMRLEKNGRIIMHSESYATYSSCKRAMKMLWRCMTDVDLYMDGDPMVIGL